MIRLGVDRYFDSDYFEIEC